MLGAVVPLMVTMVPGSCEDVQVFDEQLYTINFPATEPATLSGSAMKPRSEKLGDALIDEWSLASITSGSLTSPTLIAGAKGSAVVAPSNRLTPN